MVTILKNSTFGPHILLTCFVQIS